MFDELLINSIADIFKKNKWNVAAAESVTAGLLQAAFSLAENASLFFQGGITAYNVGQKCRHLLVEPLHALECNSVSVKVAEDMSLQVCNMFTSTYGLGVTGYAARIPEKNINELFAYYSIAAKEKIIESGIIYSTEEEGLKAQLDFTHQVLKKLKSIVQACNR